jgi:hypothetical protein
MNSRNLFLLEERFGKLSLVESFIKNSIPARLEAIVYG